MPITRFDPFENLISGDSFDRLFNESLPRIFRGETLAPRQWAPPVDIYETPESLILKAELPGVNPDDVEVRVEKGVLYLKGERKFESTIKRENYHKIERAYGTFTRSFVLPTSVQTDKIVAEYKDGLLSLTMPKREEAKPKAIKIEVAKA